MKIETLLSLVLASFVAVAARADTIKDCKKALSPKKQIDACTQLIENAKTKRKLKAQAFQIRGRVRMNAGDNLKALEDFSGAIALDANNHKALAGRATVRLSLGKGELAIADLDKAIKLNPKSNPYLMSRGHAHLATGKFDAAIKDFDLVIKRQPSDAVALNNRGLAYRMKDDLKRALDNYSAAINVSPLYALAYSNRGHVYNLMGEKEKAIADFRRALFIDPTLTSAQKGLRGLGAARDIAAHTDKLVRDGKTIAEKNCAWCHDISGKGPSSNPSAPPFSALQDRHPLLALRKPIERGIAAPHDNMPKFDLSDIQIDQLVAYINSLDDTQ